MTVHSPKFSEIVETAFDTLMLEAGQGFNPYMLRRAHAADIRRLDAMSEAELKARGIRRIDIPRLVLADLLGG